VSGTRAEAGSEACEGIEVAANEGVQAHAVVAGLVLSPLQERASIIEFKIKLCLKPKKSK
jgi:hypothetical protein